MTALDPTSPTAGEKNLRAARAWWPSRAKTEDRQPPDYERDGQMADFEPSIEPHEGDLCAWIIPQVPGGAFRVAVNSVADGRRIVAILEGFSAFEYLNNVKPDYSEVSGVARWEQVDGEWDWYEVEEDAT